MRYLASTILMGLMALLSLVWAAHPGVPVLVRLSTGKRVQKASDDPVAATLAETAANRLSRTTADLRALDASRATQRFATAFGGRAAAANYHGVRIARLLAAKMGLRPVDVLPFMARPLAREAARALGRSASRAFAGYCEAITECFMRHGVIQY